MDKSEVIMDQVDRISRRRDRVRSDHLILVEDLGYTHEEANNIIRDAVIKRLSQERKRAIKEGLDN